MSYINLQIFSTPFVCFFFLCLSFTLLFKELLFISVGAIDTIPSVSGTDIEAIRWETTLIRWFFCKVIEFDYVFIYNENLNNEVKIDVTMKVEFIDL